MRWVVIWVTASLVTASFGYTIDRNIHVTEEPQISTMTSIPLAKINGSQTNYIPIIMDNNLLNEVNNEDDESNNVNSAESSNEIPQPSNEVPETSNELPETSNEIPEPSNEIPEQSNEMPNPSHEIPDQSNDVLNPSNEIPNPSNEIPNPSNEIPNPSNEIPGSSLESTSVERISNEEVSAESESMPRSASNDVSNDSSPDNNSNGGPSASIESNEVEDPAIKETTLGPVKGMQWYETEIFAFNDIPYGKIETPFEAPLTATAWTKVHEVKEHSKRCPHYKDDTYIGDLDCLTLSVFIPAGAKNASVFFYIHDSHFYSGDPMIYGPEHLVSKGVILVLPNYRIGALGFLCLQNATAPGNAGLKDLSKALEWVVDNIEGFGGNPLNIAVGGDGDAGALAGYLALSPRAKTHISKVITESGSMLSHVALDRNPVNVAQTLAENIRKSHPETITNNVFAETSVEVIVKAAKDMNFNPCIEQNNEPFMNVSPWALLQNMGIDITFMIGSASHAGAHEAVATTDAFIENMNKDYGLILPEDLSFESITERENHALKVKEQYFRNATISRDQVQELSLWSTDASYLGPIIRSSRCLVDAGATVYLFEFDYVGNLNRELIALQKPVEGAVRSDIIGYLFTQDSYVPEASTQDKEMIELMVELWVTFINTGIPTASGIEQWSELKTGEESEEEYLHITSEPKTVKGVYVDRLRLWTELYNEYFIERNYGLSNSPSNYLFITIIFWITRTKLDFQ